MDPTLAMWIHPDSARALAGGLSRWIQRSPCGSIPTVQGRSREVVLPMVVRA